MTADSAIEEVVTEEVSEEISEESTEESHGIDMESAVDSLGKDIFGVEPKESEEDEPEEVIDKATDEPSEKTEDTTEETDAEEKDAPVSWKKDMHEQWSKLDPAVQEYIETREEQMKEGLDVDRGDSNLGRSIRDVMTPYHDFLQKKGMDELAAVKNLMAIHYQMDTAPDNDKLALLNQLANSYGLNLNGEKSEVDPQIKSLQDEINGVRNILNERTQADLQSAREQVVQEVEEFASNEAHPYFEEIESDIAQLITAGYSLEDAYEKSVWANPITRQKEMNRIQQEKGAAQLDEARKKAETAKKAKAANVRSRDTKNAPTGSLGTIEDTLKATMKEIKGRG